MILQYQQNGNLVAGIHDLSWSEFLNEFGYTQHRKELLDGLLVALKALKKNNCQTVLIDGSFVTKTEKPNDFDACFIEAGMKEEDFKNLIVEFPEFIDPTPKRRLQKARFKGEIFPATAIAKYSPIEIYVAFFQHDRNDIPKGIIKISLNTIP